MGDMGKMLKQAAKLQAEMQKVREELASERVEATAGGGVVRAVANGHGELVELVIDPAVVDPSDMSMLSDLILAAVNEAQRSAQAMAEGRMRALTGGLNIPGFPGL